MWCSAVRDAPTAVAIADLDGDTDLDLVVANADSGNVSVLLNPGDGTFGIELTYPTGSLPSSVAIEDIDGDGGLDLAVANEGDANVSVLLSRSVCLIDGVCYAEGDTDPGNECRVCDPQSSTTEWSDVENACLINEVCYMDGDRNPQDDCQECDPQLSTTDWSYAGAGTPSSDCFDVSPCTCDQCDGAGGCLYVWRNYGDVSCDGAIGISDILCILDGFSGDFSVCTFQDDDLEPCPGNGAINVSDLYAVLNAFGGADPCCTGACCLDTQTCVDDYGMEQCVTNEGVFQGGETECLTVDCSTRGAGGEGGESPLMDPPTSGGGTVEITLLAKESTRSGETVYEVEVFASDFVDLRGYQVAVDITGGETGTLDLEDVYIDLERKDHVFGGLASYDAVDVGNGRMMCVLSEGGVSSIDPLYLGTFVLRAAPETSGTFQVIPRAGDGTILLDSAGRRLEIVNAAEAAVLVK